jgi:hypothetical protein
MASAAFLSRYEVDYRKTQAPNSIPETGTSLQRAETNNELFSETFHKLNLRIEVTCATFASTLTESEMIPDDYRYRAPILAS